MHACIPNVQVRDVPDDFHQELVRRAGHSGRQSLQRFLAMQLALLIASPSLDDVLDRIEQCGGARLSPADAIEALEAERARR